MKDIVELGGVRLDISSPKITPPIRKGIQDGWYEMGELHAVVKLAMDGDTILEIGGGCGFTSAFIAKRFRNSRVISVEADPELISIMKRNHDLNCVSVDVVNEVLGHGSGEVDFFIHDDYWASNLERHGGSSGAEKRRVRVPMSDFRQRLYEWRPVTILVDIEGGELDLLSKPLPDFVKAIVVESHEWAYGPGGRKRLIASLAQMGFALVPDASKRSILSCRR